MIRASGYSLRIAIRASIPFISGESSRRVVANMLKLQRARQIFWRKTWHICRNQTGDSQYHSVSVCTTAKVVIAVDFERVVEESAALSGQVAVVTGGGRGIGRAIALALATAGAWTAVLARSQSELDTTVQLIEHAGGRARAFVSDVTDVLAVRNAMRNIEQALGPVDLLVNNAATGGPIGPFWETDTEQWWQALEVNLRGPVLCSRAVLPGMVARHQGRIVNVASS